MLALPALALIVTCILALILGFAAHRASVCTVRGVAEILHAGTLYMAASIAKSALWVLLVTLPVFWLVPGAASAVTGWPLTSAVVAGGFLFGAGAGLNGACAYSLMARLVDGEGGMLVAVGGFAIGVLGFVLLLDAGMLARDAQVPAGVGPFAAEGGLAVLLLVAIVALWAAWEAWRLWRKRPPGAGLLARQYRLSSAALVIGASAALIFLLFGPSGYSATFEIVIEGALGTRDWPIPARWLVLVCVLLGMALSTWERGSFRLDWRPRLGWVRNLAGGILMGLGAALAHGGNDAFVLYGIPSLSPHAVPAYAAMAVGILLGLWAARRAFGFELRVVCRNDLYITDGLPAKGR